MKDILNKAGYRVHKYYLDSFYSMFGLDTLINIFYHIEMSQLRNLGIK